MNVSSISPSCIRGIPKSLLPSPLSPSHVVITPVHIQVRTKYTKVAIPRYRKVSAIMNYPITSPRLNIPTAKQRTDKIITELHTFLKKKGAGGTQPTINEDLAIEAMMTTATREQLQKLYSIMIGQPELSSSPSFHNAYLSHLTNLGFPLDVQKTYEELAKTLEPWPSDQIDNTLLTAYCKSEQIEKALELYGKLKESNRPIDTRAYRSFMNYYYDQGEMRKGFAIYEEMLSNKVKPDIAAYNALLRGYRMCGFTDKFEETFQKMKTEGVEPDVVSHTERIIAYGKTKNMEQMIKKLQEMKDEGFQPTHVTYNAMVWLFMKNTHWESASAILESMVRERQLPLDMKAVTKLATYFAGGSVYRNNLLRVPLRDRVCVPGESSAGNSPGHAFFVYARKGDVLSKAVDQSTDFTYIRKVLIQK